MHLLITPPTHLSIQTPPTPTHPSKHPSIQHSHVPFMCYIMSLLPPMYLPNSSTSLYFQILFFTFLYCHYHRLRPRHRQLFPGLLNWLSHFHSQLFPQLIPHTGGWAVNILKPQMWCPSVFIIYQWHHTTIKIKPNSFTWATKAC